MWGCSDAGSGRLGRTSWPVLAPKLNRSQPAPVACAVPASLVFTIGALEPLRERIARGIERHVVPNLG